MISYTSGVAANLRRVWTRMGTPPNSLNCLVGTFFLALVAEGDAMRVPNPAAGIITKTFIGGDQYSTGTEVGASALRLLRIGNLEFGVIKIGQSFAPTGRGLD